MARKVFATSMLILYLSLVVLTLPVHANGKGWILTGSMSTARDTPASALLPNGDMLVTGGAENDNSCIFYASAEIYNSATGNWNPTASMKTARAWHSATSLFSTGKVLVAGGWHYYQDINNETQTNSAELYDPATANWTATGSLHIKRAAHKATLLQNGQVLVVGGVSDDAVIHNPGHPGAIR